MIVDDSIFIRAVLKQILEADPQKRFRVVASAQDGQDAIIKLNSFDIDVITMDVEMPNKNGLEAVKEIMATNPRPIVMLSSITKKGTKETIEALSSGAIDFITKPNSRVDFSELKDEICEKVAQAMLSKDRLIKADNYLELNSKYLEKYKFTQNVLSNLIVIGCSAGGPKALQKIVAELPADLNAGVVIVQHMPEGGFITSLAEHLNSLSVFTIKEARDGEEIKNGNIYIAPGGFHTEIYRRGDKYRIVLNKRESSAGHRPSVDVLFASVARLKSDMTIVGMILTGMGSDGLKGCQALKTQKHTIIAESEKTAIIYGMPKQVINKGLADFVMDLGDIVTKAVEIIK